jgi:hypothetical protein
MAAKAKKTFCCPQCRLLHDTPVRRCRHCGAESPLPLSKLVITERRKKWVRRIPPRHPKMRVLDGLFVVALVFIPNLIDRHHPAWTVPALVGLASAWAIVRLFHGIFARFRRQWVEGAKRVDSVPAGQPRCEPEFRGSVRKLEQTVDAKLAKRRGVAREAWLADKNGVLLLRSQSAERFAVAHEAETRVVEGSLRVAAKQRMESDIEDAESALDCALDSPWRKDGARVYELLLESRDRVAICGGVERRERIASLGKKEVAVLRGSPANPIWILIEKKSGPAGS